MSGRKRHHFVHQPDEVFRLAGEDDCAVGVVAVVQRTDADGIARGDEVFALRVVDHERILRVEFPEQVESVFFIQRQQNFAVGFALERDAFLQKRVADGTEAIDLAVAHQGVFAVRERLHALRVQSHDGKAVEAERRAADFQHLRAVRPAGDRLVKARSERLIRNGAADVT